MGTCAQKAISVVVITAIVVPPLSRRTSGPRVIDVNDILSYDKDGNLKEDTDDEDVFVPSSIDGSMDNDRR